MARDKRIELLQMIFKETAVPKTSPPPATKPGVKVTVSVDSNLCDREVLCRILLAFQMIRTFKSAH